VIPDLADREVRVVGIADGYRVAESRRHCDANQRLFNDRNPMKKIKTCVGRLALNKETVRKLGDPDLVAISAGWQCSVTGSGKVLCSPTTTEDVMAGKPASS
jgi:hypothetical protein